MKDHQLVMANVVLLSRSEMALLIKAADSGDEVAMRVTVALADAVAACLGERRHSKRALQPPHQCMICDALIVQEKPDVFAALLFEAPYAEMVSGLHRACTAGKTDDEIMNAVEAGINRVLVKAGAPEAKTFDRANIHPTGGSA